MKPGLAVAAAPSIGPFIVTVFGVDVPVLALSVSVLALVLARMVAPPALEKLSKVQEIALTLLLVIMLFLIVTGQFPLFGDGKPIGVGMAVMWAMGLGFSGMLVVKLMGERAIGVLRAALGTPAIERTDNDDAR